MPLACRQSGFSLIEATVAGAILLAACVALTGTLVAGLRANQLVATQTRLEALAASERARLLALPYTAVPPASIPTATPDAPSPSLLADLLADAQPAATGADAVPGGAEATVFVSRFPVGEATVERRTRFIRRRGTDWTGVPANVIDTQGAIAGGAPASTVDVLIVARQGTHTATRVLRAGALSGVSAPPTAGDSNAP